MKKIIFSLIIFSGILFLYTIIFNPLNRHIYPIKIEYKASESVSQFVKKLAVSHIILNKELFKQILIFNELDKNIKPGIYTFTKPLNIFKIAKKISNESNTSKGIKITIPEGSSRNDISFIIKKIFPNLDSDQFIVSSENKEGYLFPDTYYFSSQVTIEEIIEKLENTWKEKTMILFLNKSKKDIQNIVIMASILEKEGKTREERGIISGILWKRLKEDIRLQVDATFLYTHNKGTSFLTLNDLKNDNPYNTYTRAGLPIGPINNPGLETLKSALYPIESPYYFYLHDTNGIIHYAKTFDEHKRNKALYLR